MKSSRGLVAWGCALILMLSACASDTTDDTTQGTATETTGENVADTTASTLGEEEPSQQSIVMAMPIDITGTAVDPAFSTALGYAMAFVNVYDGLFSFDADGRVAPSLATEEVVSEDGLTHTLTIRNDVLFHDGSPMTVEDVKFSIDRARGAGDEPVTATTVSNLATIESVDIVDESTVVLNMNEPDPTLANRLAFDAGLVVPKAYLEEVGNEGFANAPIGTGRYKVVEIVQGQELRLEAFEDYWDDEPPSIQSAVLMVVPDAASRVAQLQAGDVDFAFRIEPSQVAPLEQGGLTISAHPNGINVYASIDRERGMLDDIRVRQALNYAIDREAIVRSIYLGYGQQASSLNPTIATVDPSLEPYPYDPEMAKALLNEAGFDFDSQLSIAVPPHIQLSSDVAAAMASDLQEIGVTLQVVELDEATWREQVVAHELGTDMTIIPALNQYQDPVAAVAVSISCEGGASISRVCDEALEESFDEVRAASGDARIEAIHAFDSFTHDDPPAIFLAHQFAINGMRAEVVWDPSTPDGSEYALLEDLSVGS